MRTTSAIVILCLLPWAASAQAPDAEPRLALELEAGAVWQSRNVAQVPNDGSGTRFSIADLAGTGPWPAGRLYVDWRLRGAHGLRLLIAPLGVSATGTPAQDVQFAGATYAAGTPVDAEYVFNSYRLSYRYRFRDTPQTSAWVGFTAKVRDAHVALSQGTISSRKDDVGFVPLLHLSGTWRATPAWTASADFDGLAGGPGRAFDVAVKLGYVVTPGWTLQAGYRTVEGGADVAAVYAFAWLHYAYLGARWQPGP